MLNTNSPLNAPNQPITAVSTEIKPSKTANYPFINLIRFISMIGIVWEHVHAFPPSDNASILDIFDRTDHPYILIIFYQIFKFSTVCFFMISGFLLGEKLNTINSKTYFKKRLSTTIKPYLVSSFILFLIIFIRFFFLHRQMNEVKSVGDIIIFILFNSWLWYLPNYLISLAVILCFNKIVDRKSFGACLLLITVVYSLLTVYFKQFMIPHSYALFAFVFYLWFGIYTNRNNVINKIKNLKISILFSLMIITLILSCLESVYLYHLKLNFLSTLRIFNQLYSLAMFAFLIRICLNPPKFGFFNPRKETYGIYLYHGIILYILPKFVTFINSHFHIKLYSSFVYSYIPIDIFLFVITYLTTTLLVKGLLKYKLGYL